VIASSVPTMTFAIIRDISENDHEPILFINEESVEFLSPLTQHSFRSLQREAAYRRGVEIEGRIVAFLLAFREGANYQSANYRWFAERYSRFLYVDRIVVDRRYQRSGLGRLLYADLFKFAYESESERITCEFDIDPPNEASQRFHASYTFRMIGTQKLNSGKIVAMQELEVAALR